MDVGNRSANGLLAVVIEVITWRTILIDQTKRFKRFQFLVRLIANYSQKKIILYIIYIPLLIDILWMLLRNYFICIWRSNSPRSEWGTWSMRNYKYTICKMYTAIEPWFSGNFSWYSTSELKASSFAGTYCMTRIRLYKVLCLLESQVKTTY